MNKLPEYLSVELDTIFDDYSDPIGVIFNPERKGEESNLIADEIVRRYNNKNDYILTHSGGNTIKSHVGKEKKNRFGTSLKKLFNAGWKKKMISP